MFNYVSHDMFVTLKKKKKLNNNNYHAFSKKTVLFLLSFRIDTSRMHTIDNVCMTACSPEVCAKSHGRVLRIQSTPQDAAACNPSNLRLNFLLWPFCCEIGVPSSRNNRYFTVLTAKKKTRHDRYE